MSYCQELGYKVGDLFEVVNTRSLPYYKPGDVIRLIIDDGSNAPLFKQEGTSLTRGDGMWYEDLHNIKPLPTSLENE